MSKYHPLASKKILLGITGSIAAYKCASLVRLLVTSGAEVRVIMTHAAADFISPLTMSTLSKNEVLLDLFKDGAWSNHVELGLWADAMVVAPCTANSIAKLAHGIADNFLVASYLSAKCPVFIAPAMDLDMYKHPSTKRNLAILKQDHVTIIPVGTGELASGLVGEGRMAEPEEILQFLGDHISKTGALIDKKVLITAGPTYEKIDPVRFIGNWSSGKMGVELAKECASLGAHVDLVLGPSFQKVNHPNINVIPVVTAQEMYDASIASYPSCDIGIMAAAVADYRPTTYQNKKIKKKDGELQIALERTQDIAAQLGKTKSDQQLLIGFALETQDGVKNATDKVKRKNFDLIVLNSLEDKGAGFRGNTNKVTVIHKSGEMKKYSLKSKTKVAKDIVNEVVAYIDAN